MSITPKPTPFTLKANVDRNSAVGKSPYFVGKPNPFMMRSALDRLGVRASDAVMVGDRMDTDIVAGLESGLRTVLVPTGRDAARRHRALSVQARPVVERVADLGEAAAGE